MDISLLISGLSSLMGHKIYTQEEANKIVSEYGNQITIVKASLEEIYTKSLQAVAIGEVLILMQPILKKVLARHSLKLIFIEQLQDCLWVTTLMNLSWSIKSLP